MWVKYFQICKYLGTKKKVFQKPIILFPLHLCEKYQLILEGRSNRFGGKCSGFWGNFSSSSAPSWLLNRAQVWYFTVCHWKMGRPLFRRELCVGNELTHVSGECQTAHARVAWGPSVSRPEGPFKCCARETRQAVAAQDRGRPGLESAPAHCPCVTTSHLDYEATAVI